MKNLSVYLPSPRLFVAVLIVLGVTTCALRAGSSNPTVAKVRTYLGLSA
jgi:hypothetical protein